PHTCGYTVGYHTLKTIVAYWLSATPVTMPLSQDGPLPTCGESTDDCQTAQCIDGWICQLAEMQDPTDFVGLPAPPTVVVDGGPDRVLTCAQPSVTLSAVTSGGVAPFKYEWRDAQAQTIGTQRTLSVDTPGIYTLIATSCGGCLAIDSVTVTEDVAQPIVAVSVSEILTGYVTLVDVVAIISGGSAPFAIVWDIPSGELVYDVLALGVSQPGVYTMTATGVNGCSSFASITVLQDIEPPSVQIDIIPTFVVDAVPTDAVLTCSLPEIVLESQVSGGREPYILQWTNSQGAILSDATTLNVNTPDTYVLTATGANGVSASISVEVGQDIEPPTVSLSANGELTCTVTEVSLSATVDGGRTPYVVEWTRPDGEIIGSNRDLTVAAPGSYTVTVTGSNGCSSSASIVVEQNIEPPSIYTFMDGILTCSVSEVTVSVVASGGREPY
ncbi:PKD domain-containing protein, partial [Candidatus Bipolaricaulota bacterium]|nr:PKD domain-containing protein [Candidatus Bipolaricaulota bacterium]